MKYLTYDDIALVPNFSEIKSRSECNTTTSLGYLNFKLPVMPANMKCVINTKVAHYLSENDYFYVMHRFCDNLAFIKQAQKWATISISVGVKPEDKKLIKDIFDQNLKVNYITIDIAHGHSLHMAEMITHIKNLFGDEVFIIAGNVCTSAGYIDLAKWGANAVKVGIGQGAACTTKLKTGFTMPMFTCIQKIKKTKDNLVDLQDFGYNFNVPAIIADGGIKHNGDIAKALVAGADWVMAGGLFAKCSDSPADTTADGEKIYFGSASAENKGEHKHVEGKKMMLSTDMTYAEKLNEIKEDLQSAISYAGGTSVEQLQSTSYIEV
jgi:GMP reductase